MKSPRTAKPLRTLQEKISSLNEVKDIPVCFS